MVISISQRRKFMKGDIISYLHFYFAFYFIILALLYKYIKKNAILYNHNPLRNKYNLMSIIKEIAANLEKGDSSNVKELCRQALSLSFSADKILNQGLVKGMEAVGIKFKKNEIFIPEVLIATRAMKAGLEILRPQLSREEKKLREKIVIGTVKGDLHDIGKKIVGMMLEKEGYEIIDIGIDVAKENFVKAIKQKKPYVVGMSALLTTTMTYMREVIEAVDKAKLRDKVKIIVGGAPVTQSFADEIKADGYAPDAAVAVDLVNNLFQN